MKCILIISVFICCCDHSNRDARDEINLAKNLISINNTETINRAIRLLNKSIRTSPNNQKYYYLALAWFYKGDYNLAISNFTRCIEIEPNDNRCYLNRGRAYAFLGKQEDALNDFTIITKSNIKMNENGRKILGDTFFETGKIYLLRADFHGATNHFVASINISTDDQLIGQNYYHIAMCGVGAIILDNKNELRYKPATIYFLARSCSYGYLDACDYEINSDNSWNLLFIKYRDHKMGEVTYFNPVSPTGD